MWIVSVALRRPYTVAVLSLFILLMGGMAITQMRRDIFPQINIPVVLVVWSYPGLPAQDMERRVVLLSERAYSTTVNGISRIESQSISGIGLVKLYFEPGAEIGAAIAQIASVSQTAMRAMPHGIVAPNVIEYNASNVPVAQLTIRSDSRSEQELFDYGLNFLRIRLFTVPGLSTPAPYGGKLRQVMVDVDPEACAARNLSAQDVLQALLAANVILPAGTLRTDDLEYDVTINNSPTSIAGFKRIPIKNMNGATVLLGDVAQVRDGFAVQQNIVRVNGKRATYLAILKKADASTLAVVDSVRDLLPSIQELAPEGIEVTLQNDQSIFVRQAIAGVLHEGWVSSVLVSAMIMLFLGSWRSVLIVCTSIPLAISTALIGLYLMGDTLNIMTLGGLSLAIGMLVDDATVEVENIHRNRHLGKRLVRAIMDGAAQIATPALAATATICIVFFPVILLSGPARYLFTPLAKSVVISMIASYGLSRTLVPAMAQILMAKEQTVPPDNARHWLEKFNIARDLAFERFTSSYVNALWAALGRRSFVLVIFALLTLNAAAMAQVVGRDFFPEVDAGQMKLHIRAPLGRRIEDTEGLVAQIEREIRHIIPEHELANITDNIGIPTSYNMAFVQTDNLGGQDAEIQITLARKHAPTQKYQQLIRRKLDENFVGTHAYFLPADIISQVLNFGLTAPLDLEIEGPDLETSAQLALHLSHSLQRIPGVVDLRVVQAMGHPALHLEVDREYAAQLGLTQTDVASAMLTSLSGSSLVAPSFWLNPQNNVNYLVAVQTPLERLSSVSHLMATPIAGPSSAAKGTFTPYLASLARIKTSQTNSLISHDLVQRVVNLQCAVAGRDLGSVAAEIEQAIASLGELPTGHSVHLRGQSKSMNDSFRSLGLGVILAAVLVYLLLVVLFQSWLDPLIIMVAVPGALIGVIFMLALTHTTINVESLMGMIMAIGVAVSNSILLVSFANEVRYERKLTALAAALEAGRTRMRPVLMTALAMILGMIPMAMGMGEGGEQNAPLGRAVIGGLLVATCVTLFVVPVVYSLLRGKMPDLADRDAAFARQLEA